MEFLVYEKSDMCNGDLNPKPLDERLRHYNSATEVGGVIILFP